MSQHDIFMEALRQVANLCAVAAMTAPKSGGQLFLKGAKPFIETASLHNIDTRCQTRIAAAARHLHVIEADLAVALSMSVTHKNIFFDKKMPDIKFPV